MLEMVANACKTPVPERDSAIGTGVS